MVAGQDARRLPAGCPLSPRDRGIQARTRTWRAPPRAWSAEQRNRRGHTFDPFSCPPRPTSCSVIFRSEAIVRRISPHGLDSSALGLDRGILDASWHDHFASSSPPLSITSPPRATSAADLPRQPRSPGVAGRATMLCREIPQLPRLWLGHGASCPATAGGSPALQELRDSNQGRSGWPSPVGVVRVLRSHETGERHE
jgi:hypothetical protein